MVSQSYDLLRMKMWKSIAQRRLYAFFFMVATFLSIGGLILFAILLFTNVEDEESRTIANLRPPYDIQPQQIHLSIGESPQEIVVTWTTINQTIGRSTVSYGTGSQINQIACGTVRKFIDGGPEKRVIYIYRVTLKNLQPNTTYIYHVGSPEAISSIFFFNTLPLYKKPFSWSPKLVIFGDVDTEYGQIYRRLAKEAQKGTFDVALHVGDFAYDLHDDNGRVGDAFMRRMESMAAYVPYQTCPGNHEEAYNFSHYSNRFSMHSEGDPSIRNHYWSYNIGPAHLISFSTEFHFFTQYGTHQILNQYRWLEEDLKMANLPENRAKHPWIITMGHRPLYGELEEINKEDELIRVGNATFPGFEKLFYKYGVDLCFWGHIHNYERLWPIYNGTVRNGSLEEPYRNPKAPVHITTGSGGTVDMTPVLENRPGFSAYVNADFGFTRLNLLNGTHLHLQQISENQNGQIIDEFYLIKTTNRPTAWL